MSPLSDSLRQEIIERAQNRCEYCQAPLTIVVTVEIDHIVPESAGGESVSDNLCAACRGCNLYKQAFQTATDPATGEIVPLFNPRTQVWLKHFEWIENSTRILGLTPTGRATVQRLRMNRADVITARECWVEAGWHPPKFE